MYISESIAATAATPRNVTVNDIKPTSVRVSWQAAEGADQYSVTLTKIQGKGRCPSDSHIVSVVTYSIIIVAVQPDMLIPYTAYTITIRAENDTLGTSEPSDPVVFTTKQTSKLNILS